MDDFMSDWFITRVSLGNRAINFPRLFEFRLSNKIYQCELVFKDSKPYYLMFCMGKDGLHFEWGSCSKMTISSNGEYTLSVSRFADENSTLSVAASEVLNDLCYKYFHWIPMTS